MRHRFLVLAVGGAAMLAFPATGLADTIDVSLVSRSSAPYARRTGGT
jgi:hypothetical protein